MEQSEKGLSGELRLPRWVGEETTPSSGQEAPSLTWPRTLHGSLEPQFPSVLSGEVERNAS